MKVNLSYQTSLSKSKVDLTLPLHLQPFLILQQLFFNQPIRALLPSTLMTFSQFIPRRLAAHLLEYIPLDSFYNICVTGAGADSIKSSSLILASTRPFLCKLLQDSPISNQIILPDFNINEIGNLLELGFTGE